MATEIQAELLYQTKEVTILGEGPSWNSKQGVLYWVDIRTNKIHCYNPNTRTNDTITLDQSPGCVVSTKSGGLVTALRDGIYWLSGFKNKSEKPLLLASPEKEKKENRFNDGKCDPKGRLWCGTMEDAMKNGPLGSLYQLATDLSCKKMWDKIEISNGLAWSPDHKTMYYIDSPLKTVDAFDYNVDTGDISNRRTVIRIAEGVPDGMSIDVEGNVWVAHWEGYRITCWNPTTGKLLKIIKLPVSKITSCCFGGPTLEDLYITTASENSDLKKEPLAGSLFIVRNIGVKGFAEVEFDDSKVQKH